jgi:hypothetical protein
MSITWRGKRLGKTSKISNKRGKQKQLFSAIDIDILAD